MDFHPPHPSPTTRKAGPWRHGSFPVVGLIGGIGSGKSQVAACFAARGARVIDADAVGHAILTDDTVRDEIVTLFGPEVLATGDNSAIDRRALGRIVFASPDALNALEAVVHPRMRRNFAETIQRVAQEGGVPAVILDAAILLEAGWDALCDRIVFVDAPADARQARVMQNRGWSAAMLESRERAQWPLADKRAAADLLLSNDASLERLEQEVERIWATLLEPERSESTPTGSAEPRPGHAPQREQFSSIRRADVSRAIPANLDPETRVQPGSPQRFRPAQVSINAI